MQAKRTAQSANTYDVVAWVLAALALFLTLRLHLLSALLAGLLIYQLVHAFAGRVKITQLSQRRAKLLAIGVIAVFSIGAVIAAVLGVEALLHAENGGLSALLGKLAEILERSRAILPVSVSEILPNDADDLRARAIDWLREHGRELSGIGIETGRTTAHIVIGMILGAMISLQEAMAPPERGPFRAALVERVRRFSISFRNIIAAQAKVALANAFFTWLYLVVVLPLFGVKLPFTATLVVLTFVVGLLPVVGNIISNTVIVLVSLGHSFNVAVSSLAFLVAIHKLEYFLGAKWVSTRIDARAWELLIAMLVMEAAFGAFGVVAAPIYYAYLKRELRDQGLI
jgi:predicted PurR-regulated permease PerM